MASGLALVSSTMACVDGRSFAALAYSFSLPTTSSLKYSYVPEELSRESSTIGLVGAADVLPVGDLAAVDLAELVHRQRGDGVRGVDDDRDAVLGDLGLDRLDALALGLGDLLGLHLARGVGEVHGAVDQRRDARARTAALERDHHARVLGLEDLGPRLAQVDHRVGALDVDGARELLGRRLSACRSRFAGVAATHKPEGQDGCERQHDPLLQCDSPSPCPVAHVAGPLVSVGGHASDAERGSGCTEVNSDQRVCKTFVKLGPHVARGVQ